MVEPLGFEPKSYEFTLVLIAVETFLDPIWSWMSDLNRQPIAYKAIALPIELIQRKSHNLLTH